MRVVCVDPAARDRAAVLAALAHARDLAAAAVSEALGLAPPLGGDDDPRWYADPEVEAVLDGRSDADGADPAGRPARVQVVLWPAHTALLTAGDLPPGVAVYAEPDPPGDLIRGAPFTSPAGPPGTRDRASSVASREAESGRACTPPTTCGSSAARAPDHDTAARACRTPVEVVLDLGDARHAWQGDLQIDTAYQVLLAAAAARRRTHGDVTVLEESVGEPDPDLVCVLRVSLPDVTTATPVDALMALGSAAVTAVRAPLRQLEREVTAAVRATHARLRRA